VLIQLAVSLRIWPVRYNEACSKYEGGIMRHTGQCCSIATAGYVIAGVVLPAYVLLGIG
jgi:hypothetical protein